jgi:hypothetical protein
MPCVDVDFVSDHITPGRIRSDPVKSNQVRLSLVRSRTVYPAQYIPAYDQSVIRLCEGLNSRCLMRGRRGGDDWLKGFLYGLSMGLRDVEDQECRY